MFDLTIKFDERLNNLNGNRHGKLSRGLRDMLIMVNFD